MIDDSALLKMITQMQEKLNPPALVPFTAIHNAIREETLAALRRLIKEKRLTYHRQLNDHSVSIDNKE